MSERQSQFIEVDSISDSDYLSFFGSSVNRRISAKNFFDEIRDKVFTPFIYPSVALLQAADLEADEDNPTYVRVEENQYKLYKITNFAPGPDDISLNNGTTATFQIEYRDIGFVVGPDSSNPGAIAVYADSSGANLGEGPVISPIGEAIVSVPSLSQESFIKVGPDDSVELRTKSQLKTDLSIPSDTIASLGGKITGPDSSADDQVALFDGVTGKLLKAGQTLTQILNGWLVQLYNIFPRKINSWAEISSTPVVGAGQLFELVQHTSGLWGGGKFISVAGSVTDDNGTQKNSATAGFYLKRIGYEDLTLEMFGAIGDGETNDTNSILKAIAATPSGGNLRGRPADYLINQTLVFPKPINLHLGSKEKARFLVSPTGSYLGSPYTAAMYFPATSSNTPSVGSAIRTVLSGFTVTANGSSPPSCYGILNSTVVYFYEVDVNFMSSAGFATIAGNGSPIPGNANGTTWTNCGTYLNGSHGWYMLGDDVNQCTHYRSVAAANGGYGFYDDGLLGNTYVGCEVIANTIGGYFATSAKPNRSAYYNCYAEEQAGSLLWNISDRCLRFGNTGAIPGTASELAIAGAGLSASPTSPPVLFSSRQMAWAEDAAYIGPETGGKWAKFGYQGWAYQHREGGKVIRLQDISANSCGLFSGSDLFIQFYNSTITANITATKPHFPAGFSLFGGGPAIVGAGTGAPTTGSYSEGAIWLNTAPTAGGFMGWVCVTGGSPGTWKTWGAISS